MREKEVKWDCIVWNCLPELKVDITYGQDIDYDSSIKEGQEMQEDQKN